MSRKKLTIDLDSYFTSPEGALELPVDDLLPTRARPDGIENAAARMDLAAKDQYPKREPIHVAKRPDGRWDVIDGNSTYAVAKIRGWETIRCIVMASGEGSPQPPPEDSQIPTE